MIADSRKAALAMSRGKELAYDLIWRPRFQRLMRERFPHHVSLPQTIRTVEYSVDRVHTHGSNPDRAR